MKVLVTTGCLLLIISMYPIWRLIKLAEQGRATNARYEFFTIFESNETTLAGHTVQLRDEIASGEYNEHDRKRGPVTILIDGRNYSIASEVIIRPKFRDGNRYFEWVRMVRLRNKDTGKFLIAIVHRIGEPPPNNITDLTHLQFRVVFMTDAGEVTEDTFAYSERNNPPYRAFLVNTVSPVVVTYYPNLIVPFLVPGLSGLVGIILVVVGVRGLNHGKR